MKKVYIRTFGCQMNTRDSEVIAGILTREGYELAGAPENADVIIFNTCSVRQHAEDKVWSEIGRLVKGKRQKVKGKSLETKPVQKGDNCVYSQTVGQRPSPPQAGPPSAETNDQRPLIGLVGCMAQNYKDGAFKRSPHIDFVVGPADIAKIPEIVQRLFDQRPKTNDQRLFELRVWETDGLVRPEDIYHTGYHAEKDHAYVVISEGCVNYCAYCVVPYTRGELRHRPHAEILREIRAAVANGITKVTLLGQNVNAYRWKVDGGRSKADGGEREGRETREEGRNKTEAGFVELLEDVNAIAGLEEFSFITSHPKDTSEKLFAAMARLDKLKKYLHLPVQSGSNRILQAMNRGYTREFYLDLADKYRRMVPSGVLTTDIIVGFPGETPADFQDTYDLLQGVRFDAAFIFKYSVRPHTTAASLADDVPQKEKERRHALVLDLQKKISLELKHS